MLILSALVALAVISSAPADSRDGAGSKGPPAPSQLTNLHPSSGHPTYTDSFYRVSCAMLKTAPKAVDAALARAKFPSDTADRLREADRWFRDQIVALWTPYPRSWEERGMRNKKVRALRKRYDDLEIGIIGMVETNRYNELLSQEVNRIFPLYFNAKEIDGCSLHQADPATTDGGIDAGK